MSIPLSSVAGVITPKSFAEQPVSLRWRSIEYFNQLPLLNASIGVNANLNYELAGTNADDANVAYDVDGGVTLTPTSAASGNQSVITPHADTGQSAVFNIEWQLQKLIRYQTQLRMPASLDDLTIWFGWKTTPTNPDAENACAYFRFQDGVNTNRFQMITQFGTLATFINSQFAPAAGDELVAAVEFAYDATSDDFYASFQLGRNYDQLQEIHRVTGFDPSNGLVLPHVGIQINADDVTAALTCRYIAASLQRYTGTFEIPPL